MKYNVTYSFYLDCSDVINEHIYGFNGHLKIKLTAIVLYMCVCDYN